MTSRFVAKRLSAVEIEPDKSNQHELNAGKLRTALGFADERIAGDLTLFLYGDSGEPSIDDGTFTLYNSRDGKPRSAEFRLYYKSQGLAEFAKAGDLLVLFREGESTALKGVVARAGSVTETRLLESLELGIRELSTFVQVLAPSATKDAALRLVTAMAPPPIHGWTVAGVTNSKFVRSAVKSGRVPSTAEMAHAAQAALLKMAGPKIDPDPFIWGALEAESALYFAIEGEVRSNQLASMLSRGESDLDAVISFAMSVQQSRKSRRGQSLQNHFSALLNREGLTFSAQCRTETGETPDFVFPSCAAYHLRSFPTAKLRMVACKSTVRDRWRQVLNEAERISPKYLLTIDPQLTTDLIGAMHTAKLRTYLPMALINNRYDSSSCRALLSSVGDLIEELRSAAAG